MFKGDYQNSVIEIFFSIQTKVDSCEASYYFMMTDYEDKHCASL